MTAKKVLDTIQDRLSWTIEQYRDAYQGTANEAERAEYMGVATAFGLFSVWIKMNVDAPQARGLSENI